MKSPDPQVPEKARRRQFSAKYKLDILAQADKCTPGEIGSLLRREGLYSSHLSNWRRQRDAGALTALSKPRGRKPSASVEKKRIAELEREVTRLRHKLEQAETIIEVQKKLSQMLGAEEGES